MTGLTQDQFYNLSTLIACHPRNRELIIYTLNELDKQLPGVKKYVSDNLFINSPVKIMLDYTIGRYFKILLNDKQNN